MSTEALQVGATSARTGDAVGSSASFDRQFAKHSGAAVEAGRSAQHVQDVLARALHRDVLPRLVLSGRHRAAAVGALRVATERAGVQRLVVEPAVADQAADVAALVEIALARSTIDTVTFVEERRAAGLGLESIYLDLLTPAMRRLGVLWEEDLADFGQITIATERLRQVMRSCSLAQQTLSNRPHATKRALLVPAPGDQHSFGLAMVAEFFGRAGWHLWAGVPHTTDHLLDLVKHDWFAVVGFSVSTVTRLDGLAEVIRKVRRRSQNRGIAVMVGGPVFLDHPELVAAVGADATAADGRQAVLQAHALLEFAQRTASDP